MPLLTSNVMCNKNKTVTCECHGEAYESFVCEHLTNASGVDWYSAEPIDDDPWPSAWCDKCHKAFLAEGEWNEKSENAANLKADLICHQCYESIRAKCNVHIL